MNAPATSAGPRRLRTEPAACPGCGADEPEGLRSLPGQLLPRPQRFVSARCGRCGLRYLVDRVVDADQPRLYDQDYPLHRGPALWGPFAPLVARSLAATDARRVAAVRRMLPDLGPGDAVLDVGCGRPSFLARLRRETGVEAHGLDEVADEALVRQAADGGVQLHRGLPPHVPAPVRAAAPFRLVTFWHALEHDPRARDTLDELLGLLADDARVVVEVPDGAGTVPRRLGDRWGGLHTPRHAALFETETLASLFDRVGYDVVHHRRAGTLAPFVPAALGLVDRIGFRFGSHPAWLLFPGWVAAMAVTWPWLGRPGREGQGIQLLAARPR